MWTAVAYEPSDHPVSVPSRLVLQSEDGRMVVVSKSVPDPGRGEPISEAVLAASVGDGTFVRASEPAAVGPGLWAASEEGRMVPFPLAAEEAWRASAAQDLVKRFQTPGGNPLQKLEVLRAAGALVGLDAATLMKRIMAGKRQDESVEQAFERLKKG